MKLTWERVALLVGLGFGFMLGYSFGLAAGRNETQIAAYDKGISDGIQYADDTAREGSNCGVRPPFPRNEP